MRTIIKHLFSITTITSILIVKLLPVYIHHYLVFLLGALIAIMQTAIKTTKLKNEIPIWKALIVGSTLIIITITTLKQDPLLILATTIGYTIAYLTLKKNRPNNPKK